MAFSFHFKDAIWKTSVDRSNGKLVLELRDRDKIQTTFATLDIQQRTMSPILKVEGADWWSSLLTMDKGYLFIEKYHDPQNPIDKSLIVARVGDGKVVKHFPGYQLQAYKENHLLLSKIEDPLQQISEHLPEQSDGSMEKFDLMESMVFPEGSDNFEMVKSFLSKEIVSHVDYLELRDFIVISYVTPTEEGFFFFLLVLKDDSEVFEMIIDKKLEGMAPGAFFVFENFLIFIVERNQINGIEL